MKLVEKLAQSIRDKEIEFTGIPLQTRMLAEDFHKEAETFCLSHNSEPELPKNCLLQIYQIYMGNSLKPNGTFSQKKEK
jgi:hypothetical protein